MGLVFGWAFVESFRYYIMMRRRVALGLAEPVVTNRFLLWTLWTAGLTILPLVVTAVRAVQLAHFGASDPASGLVFSEEAAWSLAVVRSTVMGVGPVIIAALWLSFFPPRSYVGWVRARAHPADARPGALAIPGRGWAVNCVLFPWAKVSGCDSGSSAAAH